MTYQDLYNEIHAVTDHKQIHTKPLMIFEKP